MPIKIPLRLISHERKICTFYKKWVRYLEGESRTSRDKRSFLNTFADPNAEEFIFAVAQNDIVHVPDCKAEFRFRATLARSEFDLIIKEKDMRKSKEMLMDKQLEFTKRFTYEPPYFPSSPNGTAYQRYTVIEDWVLDFWHPLEKAHYPKYFAKRELRKQQYIEWWERMHGPPPPCDDH